MPTPPLSSSSPSSLLYVCIGQGHYLAAPTHFTEEERAAVATLIEIHARGHVDEGDGDKCNIANWLMGVVRAMTGQHPDALVVILDADVSYFRGLHHAAYMSALEASMPREVAQ